jgi:hypothetical protein
MYATTDYRNAMRGRYFEEDACFMMLREYVELTCDVARRETLRRPQFTLDQWRGVRGPQA